MHIVHSVKAFLTKHKISPASGIVVGVSTGIDSMVLLHVLQQLNFRIAIAHVNHGAREASENEEIFIQNFGNTQNIPVKIFHLNAKENLPQGENFQAWARKKRYEFFNQVAAANQCQFIATAHHQDDKAETFFMHALRGSGLNGLTSLLPVNGNVIRPLLHINRQEIEGFAQTEKLVWHEDESNQSDHYFRNRVRHNLITALDQVEKDWRHGIALSQQNLIDEKNLLQDFVAIWAAEHVVTKNNQWHISIPALQKLSSPTTLLRYLLLQVDEFLPFQQMANCMHDDTGSYYLGKTHRALKNRDWLIVEPHAKIDDQPIVINNKTKEIIDPLHIRFHQQEKPKTFKVTDLILTKNDALLDFDKLVFPLELRLWQAGDHFIPLGMKGTKKISDYLIDQKVARNIKEKTYVLTSDNQIIWLVGHRIDERFKVCEQTQKMYLGQLHKF